MRLESGWMAAKEKKRRVVVVGVFSCALSWRRPGGAERSRAEQRPHTGIINAAQLLHINYTSWTFTLMREDRLNPLGNHFCKTL